MAGKGIYGVLKGSFLTSEYSGRNWRVILMVFFLMMIMVWSGHRADEKVVEIARLNKEKRRIKAEHIVVKKGLSTMKLESYVSKKVAKDSLYMGSDSPKKIKVIIKE